MLPTAITFQISDIFYLIYSELLKRISVESSHLFTFPQQILRVSLFFVFLSLSCFCSAGTQLHLHWGGSSIQEISSHVFIFHLRVLLSVLSALAQTYPLSPNFPPHLVLQWPSVTPIYPSPAKNLQILRSYILKPTHCIFSSFLEGWHSPFYFPHSFTAPTQ